MKNQINYSISISDEYKSAIKEIGKLSASCEKLKALGVMVLIDEAALTKSLEEIVSKAITIKKDGL